jgi:regulator of sirC expression with transglutaminase-like and TPR domain
MRVVQAITKVMYKQRGFRGNSDDYYNPDNSAINRVLELRTGIPITLSLVYMEVRFKLGAGAAAAGGLSAAGWLAARAADANSARCAACRAARAAVPMAGDQLLLL